MKKIVYTFIILLYVGCGNSEHNQSKQISYNGKKLLEQKCSKCHNIKFPPKDFTNEIAPPMMTIVFHFNDWFKAVSEQEKLIKQLDFVTDYVINPSKDKAYCTKDMLKKYGVMPSQKGAVTKDEVRAIWEYLFNNYTQKKLMQKQKALEELHSLPQGEQIAIQYKCFSCHNKTKKLVGPSFKDIGIKYKQNIQTIIKSIQEGSRKKWKISHGATMPKFSNIQENQLKIIAKWITDLN